MQLSLEVDSDVDRAFIWTAEQPIQDMSLQRRGEARKENSICTRATSGLPPLAELSCVLQRQQYEQQVLGPAAYNWRLFVCLDSMLVICIKSNIGYTISIQ